MRLNSYLAKAGVASRRRSDELIKAGQVTINGRIGQLNDQITETDKVAVNGQRLRLPKNRYILLNKPPGCVTTLKDPQGRRKVTDLIGITERVVPIGRLDYHTTGALLLSNDGELAYRLSHPRFHVDKVYEAQVEDKINVSALEHLRRGVKLQDITSAPAEARKIADHKVELTVHEGRQHQVKRMLASVGLKAQRLHRSKYAGLSVDGLQPGQWRDLTDAEISGLKSV